MIDAGCGIALKLTLRLEELGILHGSRDFESSLFRVPIDTQTAARQAPSGPVYSSILAHASAPNLPFHSL
jgi:hypothetical protein